MNSKVLASGIVTVNRWYPVAYRGYPQREIFTTLLLLEGIHPKIVQERLGHSSIKMTLDTYSHLLPGMQEGAVKALQGIFCETTSQYAA